MSADARNPPLNADPARDASPSVRGYWSQIWRSVLAWIELADSEVLYLEGAEDFDRVEGLSAEAVQLKEKREPITLRSADVADAVSNYFAHKRRNRNRAVRLRFATVARIGKERGEPFGMGLAGLELWQSARASNDKASREGVARQIAEFLVEDGKIGSEVKDFIVGASEAELFEQLIKPIEWDADIAEVPEVIQEIKDRLVVLGAAFGVTPENAKRAADHLYQEANSVATRDEDRRLTKADLIETFHENTSVSMPAGTANALLALIPELIAKAGLPGVGPIPGTALAPRRLVQEVPALPPRYFSRAEALSDIDRWLLRKPVLAIRGGTGVGKSVIAAGFALTSAQSWGWVDLRGRDAAGLQTQLDQLNAELAAGEGADNLVLDDIEFPADVHPLEAGFRKLSTALVGRGGRLIVTSAAPIPQRISLALDLGGDGTFNVQPFTGTEIEEYLIACGCATETANTWSTLIELHTRGHAQLVHSRVASLQEAGFPDPGPGDLLTSPPEVIEARAEARRFIGDLEPAERQLAYRMSLTTDALTRQQILAIASQPQAIPEPGRSLDRLIGPWIETLSGGLLRLSPLLGGVGQEVEGNAWAIEMHRRIAAARLSVRTLTQYDVSHVLFHSFLGQDWPMIIHLSMMLIPSDEKMLAALAETVRWFVFIGTGSAKSPDLNQASLFIIRMLQFRIAVAAKDLDQALSVMKRFDEELPPNLDDRLLRLSRCLFLSQVLTATELRIPLAQVVSMSTEYMKLAVELKDLLGDRQTKDVERYMKGPSGEIDAANVAAFMLADRIKSLGDFKELIALCRGLDWDVARRLLWFVGAEFPRAFFTLQRVWLVESQSSSPDWVACRDLLKEVYGLAREMELPGLAQAAAAEISRVTDEGLKDFSGAIELANAMALEIGWSPGQENEKALSLQIHGRNEEALEIWRRILPGWTPDEDFSLQQSFAHRNAAVAAAKLGLWSEAAEWLKSAYQMAPANLQLSYRVGLLIDRGYALSKSSDVAGAFASLREGVTAIAALPPDEAGQQFYSLRKRTSLLMMRIAESASGRPVDPSKEPPPACASDLTDLPAGGPQASNDLLWTLLAKIEFASGLGDRLFMENGKRLELSSSSIVRFMFGQLWLEHFLKLGPISDLPAVVAYWLEAVQLADKSREEDGAEKPLPPKTGLLDPSELSVDMLLGGMLCGLLRMLRIGPIDGAILAAWRGSAKTVGISQVLEPWLDFVDAVFVSGTTDALEASRNGSLGWAMRAAATFKLALDVSTSPSDLISVHDFWSHTLKMTPVAIYALDELEAAVVDGWRAKAGQTFQLRAPRVTGPALLQACDSGSKGWKKIGEVLLAACDAISARVPDEFRVRFRALTE